MDAEQVRAALIALRQDDLPTHGGRTLAYVYDSGLAEADAIGREALAAYGSNKWWTGIRQPPARPRTPPAGRPALWCHPGERAHPVLPGHPAVM